MAAPTLLTLVRHGETPANLAGVWHGSTDTPLTERGRRQAEAVARWLAARCPEAVALYSSPLQRAHATALAIGTALGLATQLEADLAEFHLGCWEGESYAALAGERRLWHHMRDDPDFAPHGGESPRQVAERMAAALRRIAGAHPGERVLVVTHGGALTIGLGHLIDDDYREWRKVMANCAVSELVLEPAPGLLSFNHTAHLDGV